VTGRDVFRECLDEDATYTITFLSRCHFPELLTANLFILTSSGNGTPDLVTFLRGHPHIKFLEIIIQEWQYPLVLPHVRALQLKVTECGGVKPSLVDHLPTTVKSLCLPVYLAFDEEELCVVLDRLLQVKTAIQDVSLRTGWRRGMVTYEDERLDEPLFFGRQSSNAYPARAVYIRTLSAYAGKLEEIRNIRLLDQRMLSFKDYDTVSVSDPAGSQVESSAAVSSLFIPFN
jgi:hypothetical protein